jgi:Flp pilus assembly protein TadB
MNSASAVKPAHRSWIVLAAKSIVVVQSLAIVYMLTSVWVTVAVAAGFVVVVAAVKSLSRASRQIDRIFEDELGQ